MAEKKAKSVDSEAVLKKMNPQFVNAETIKGALCNNIVMKEGHSALMMVALGGLASLDADRKFTLRITTSNGNQAQEIERAFKRIAKETDFTIDIVA